MDMPKIVGVNWPKPVCGYVFSSGKNASRECGKEIYSAKVSKLLLNKELIYDPDDMNMNYCKSHCRTLFKKQQEEQDDTPTCQGILKSGKRKGEKCNNRCASTEVDATVPVTGMFCKKHMN
jgi:hypothetical protein